MEYLVTMTTRVPSGTPEAAVDDIRAREARRAAELARAGQLLRLWRPPLQPGEWRTLGLFSAPDDGSLERALASMPLRIWRSDEPLQLSAHPNDPAAAGAGAGPVGRAGSEFLISMSVSVPRGTAPAQVDDTLSREARRARAGGPGAPAAAVVAPGGIGRASCPRPLAGGQQRRDGGDRRRVAPAPLDGGGNHPIDAASQRPDESLST